MNRNLAMILSLGAAALLCVILFGISGMTDSFAAIPLAELIVACGTVFFAAAARRDAPAAGRTAPAAA